jgi:hypothetical protein
LGDGVDKSSVVSMARAASSAVMGRTDGLTL